VTETGPRTFALIGHPVAHSLSPAIHKAAYAEFGLSDHRYGVVDCANETAVRSQFDALRSGRISGANVTVPWKRLALELADDVDASARETGAANVLRPVTGPNGVVRVVAYNTDVPALAEELRRGRPGARTAAVLGSGGAALAAVVACRTLGMDRIVVVARKWRDKSAATQWEGAQEFEARFAIPAAWPDGPDESFERMITTSDVVIQTTTDGMHGASDGTTVRDVIPWSQMPRDTFAYDVVYNPSVTPYVAAARELGLRAESGLGMLVGQAALAIELWLGKKPQPDGLRKAAERALAEKMRR
jgi:shikimate dehydrogenase